MRVLLMLSGLPLSGGERSLVSVLPYLKKTDGLTPLLCTLNTHRDGPLVDEFNKTGIERFDLDAKRLVDPASWVRFLNLLREKKIDLINSQDQYTNIFAALAFWFTNIPVVMTRHVMQEPADTLRESIRARMVLWATRSSAHKLIAVSDAVRKNLGSHAGVSLSKIETIYNGIDVERFIVNKEKEDIRLELGWGLEEKIIIMVAVLRRGKGHEVLFDAIPRIMSANPSARIKLIGDGELNTVLRQQAVQFGEVVEFLGERMDVPVLLKASDVLVLPSWSEALPTVLIEAGAASLPVVATDVGGTAEIVMDGDTGYVVQPGDSVSLAEKLIKILSDSESAREMGRRARDRVQKLFSLQRQSDLMFSLYKRTLGGL